MASKKIVKEVRLPINITIDKDDLDTDDEVVPQTTSKQNQRKNQNRNVALSSQIDVGMGDIGVYVDVYPVQDKATKAKTLESTVTDRAHLISRDLLKPDKLMEKSVIKLGFEKLESIPKYEESVRIAKAIKRKERSKTKGDQWYNLPAPEMTEEKERDLEIIQMRSILNPKQFYKKNDLKTLPKYFQVGTVVDSPVDFYHDRIPKKQRKRTLVEELMADADFQRYNKKKYAEIIQSKPQLRKPKVMKAKKK